MIPLSCELLLCSSALPFLAGPCMILSGLEKNKNKSPFFAVIVCDSDQRGKGSASVQTRFVQWSYMVVSLQQRRSFWIRAYRDKSQLDKCQRLWSLSDVHGVGRRSLTWLCWPAGSQTATKFRKPLFGVLVIPKCALQRLVFTACKLITDCSCLEIESNHLLSFLFFFFFVKGSHMIFWGCWSVYILLVIQCFGVFSGKTSL